MSEKVLMSLKEKKNMWLLMWGIGVSKVGSLAFSFAVGLYILNLTGSGMSFAISMILSALPRVLISPFAGILADRVSRKNIVVLGDIVSGLAVLCLLIQGEITVLALYVVIGLLSVANTFFSVALQSAIPNLVGDEHLMTINSNFEAFNSIAAIAGPMVGGFLFGFGSLHLIIIINGLSFLLSGFSEMFIDFKYNSKLKDVEVKEKRGYGEVWTFIKEVSLFRWMLILSLSFNFLLTMGIQVPHTYLLNNILKLSPRSIGVIEAMISVGIIIGSLVVSKYAKENTFKWLSIGSVGLGLVMVLSGLPYIFTTNINQWVNVLYQCFILMIAGFCLAILNVPIMTKMQQLIPEMLRGRVFSLFGMIGASLVPMGLLLSGLLIQTILPQYIIVVCGLLMTMVSLYFFSKEALRKSFKDVDGDLEFS